MVSSCQPTTYSISQKKLKKIEKERERRPKKGQECPSFHN